MPATLSRTPDARRLHIPHARALSSYQTMLGSGPGPCASDRVAVAAVVWRRRRGGENRRRRRPHGDAL